MGRFSNWLVNHANQQISQDQGWRGTVWNLFAADGLNAYTQLADGNYRGAAISVALALMKPLKVASKAINPQIINSIEVTVIGRIKDLEKLRVGEKSLLNRLPDKGSHKDNWKQNASVLRQEMSKGRPIRDVSPGDLAGKFLNAKRGVLKNRNWTFDSATNFWNPPT